MRDLLHPVAVKHQWKNKFLVWGLTILCLLLSSCNLQREAYFKDSVDEATQDDVEKELGKPVRTKTFHLDGETIWTYRYVMTETEMDRSGFKSLNEGINSVGDAVASLVGGPVAKRKGDKPVCIHYILTFDRSKILKDWKRESCAETPL